jgi:hypothetical protein
LNTPTTTFTITRYCITAPAMSPGPTIVERSPITAAMRKLVRGPTMAIANSERGSSGSRESSDTPPKTWSVMLDTGMPRRIETSEWDSSCRKTEANSRSAAASPLSQCVVRPSSGSA